MEVIAGPIPGENYTSDTKNYPWHRPPEFDDLDKAIEYATTKLTQNNTSLSMMTLAKSGVPLTTITEIFLTQGMSRGKWTPDYALLMAGPVTHILALMAKASKINYDLGIDDEPAQYTSAYFDAMAELDSEEQVATETMSGILGMGIESSETPLEGPGTASELQGIPSTGFAGMPPQDPSVAPEMESTGDPSVDMPETPDINMVGE